MFRKIFSIMVLMITVLTVNLLTGYITNYIIHYNLGIDPMKFTAIGMLALVFILVPAYGYMASKIEIMVAKLLLSGSNSFGKILGLLLSFGLIFSILFGIYLHEWFDINLLSTIKNSILK
jgi:hypothetical protein